MLKPHRFSACAGIFDRGARGSLQHKNTTQAQRERLQRTCAERQTAVTNEQQQRYNAHKSWKRKKTQKLQQQNTTKIHTAQKIRTRTIGCLRHTKFCWVGKHVNIIMKPTKSPTQGQLNPRNTRLKVAFGPPFPTASMLSWVGIGYILRIGSKLEKA